MKSYPVSIQLYSLREAAERDFPAVLKRIAAMGYPGVEFAGLHGVPPKELRKLLDGLGLVSSSCHGEMPDKQNLPRIVDTAKTLGYTWHISGLGSEHFATEDACLRVAETFQKAAEALKPEGLKFGIHNHWWELESRFRGKTGLQIVLSRAPGVSAQLDTYWAAVGGADPAETIGSLGARAPLLHIKDGPIDRKAAHVAVGDGRMDWKKIIGAADERALEWLIVELDSCDTDMFAAVEKSLKYLVGAGFGRARA